MAICSDGNYGANALYEKFHDSNGHLLPDISSGYFSRLYQFEPNRPLVALTVRDLWSYACWCGHNEATYTPQGCAQNYSSYRQWFCSNLYDAGGNLITDPARIPVVCGGTGPDVLPPYNPTIAALYDMQDSGQQLLDKYTGIANTNVKKITQAGLVIALLLLFIGLIFILV